MPDLKIRTMSRSDLATVLDWAAAEGWNPGVFDSEAFHAVDPEGFLIGEVDGEPACSISVVEYGPDFGFLGLFIVKPEFRGRGYGRQIWKAGLARLGARTVGLDGVVAQQERYAQEGFVTAHRTIRLSGRVQAGEVSSTALVELHHGRPVGLWGMCAIYDKPLFPGDREIFLRAWLYPPGRRTLAYVADSVVRGYGSIRRCVEGFKIGPLFADSPEIAERLFSGLVARHHGELVSLDVPEPNAAATALAERHGLAPSFEVARMYKGTMPELPLDRIFGMTTFELG